MQINFEHNRPRWLLRLPQASINGHWSQKISEENVDEDLAALSYNA